MPGSELDGELSGYKVPVACVVRELAAQEL